MSSDQPFQLRQVWLWSLSAEVSARLGTIALLVLYLPLLGDTAAGTVLIAFSYTMTAWLLVDIGLGFYGVKQVAQQDRPADEIQSEITKARLILCLPVLALLLAMLVGYFRLPVGIAAGFGVFLLARALAGEWRFRGEERFVTLAKVSILASLAQIACFAAIVRPDNWSETASLPWACSGIALLLGSWISTGMTPAALWRVESGKALSHLKTSYGFSVTNGLSVLFGQSPILLLSLFYPAAALAQFALLHRLILSANLFFQTLGAAVFPRIVRSERGDGKESRELNWAIVKISVLFSGCIGAGTLVAYAIPFVRETYLSDLQLGVLVSLLVFFLLRSVRESYMRLLLARGVMGEAMSNVGSGLVLFAVVCGVGFVLANLTILVVSIGFAVAEAVILLLMVRAGNRPNRSSPEASG